MDTISGITNSSKDCCADCKTPYAQIQHAQKFWIDAHTWVCGNCDIKRRPVREKQFDDEDARTQKNAYKSPPRLGNPFPRVWQ